MLSIAGSILVGIQIAIFWQQTRLFRQQAEAANVERAEKLRGRVGSNLAHGEVLRRFEDAFRESNLKRNSVACDEGCQRVPLQVAYKRFVELRSSSSDADSPADKTASNAGDVSVNAAAATLVELSDLLGQSIAETDAESAPLGRPSEKTRGWAQRLFNNTLQPALLSCAIGQPVQDIRIEAVFILAAADEDLGVYVPATLDEMLPRLAGDAPKFSRWVPSTSPPTLGMIRSYVEERDLGPDMLAGYTTGDFQRHFATVYERVGKVANAYAKACTFAINRDVEALEKIELGSDAR